MVLLKKKFKYGRSRKKDRSSRLSNFEAGAPTSADGDFTYANLDWESYNESRASADDADVREAVSAESGIGPDGVPTLVWVPISAPLRDGSQTIAFKMPADLATKVISGQMSPDDFSSPTSPILSRSTEVLTTPSSSDRMRGVKRGTVVVRTPSSLIDLMDDQVPDLREGLFMEPADPHYLDSYTIKNPSIAGSGSPLSGGIPVFAIYEIASLLLSGLKSLGIELTLSNIIKILKGVFINGCPFTAIPRLVKKISSGELSAWIASHRDSPIDECIKDWIKDVMFDHLSSDESADDNTLTSDNQSDMTLTDQDSVNFERTQHTLIPKETSDYKYELSADSDIACVPIAYWKRLYAMGRSFQHRDAAPRFDKLQLTGAPATDLLLNRVPEIYITNEGLPTLSSWHYATYPMAGGLFKKIGSAIKKVAKGVAKGVSKVMDSPLGSVISAIPVVGNVASVAGKVAKTVTNVMDKIDGMSGMQEDSVSDEGMPESGEEAYPQHSTRSRKSGGMSTNQTEIAISKLPTWSVPTKEKFQAPPISVLSNDPTQGPAIRTPQGDYPILIINPDELATSGDEWEKCKGSLAMSNLSDICSEIDKRGPLIAYRVIHGMWQPLTGGPQTALTSRASRPGMMSQYWKPITRFERSRRVPIRLAGDPSTDEQKLSFALVGLGAMSEWTGDSTLSQPGDGNLFAKTFFQLYSDGVTEPMFSGRTWNESALISYALNCPFVDRIKNKGVPVGAEIAASVVWAMLLVSNSALDDEKREEMASSMRSAATAGLFKNKAIDSLQALALKGEWPSTSQFSDAKFAKNWTRMMTLTILYIWNDASGASSSAFAQKMADVCYPSVDAVCVMKAMMTAHTQSASEQALKEISSDVAAEKVSSESSGTYIAAQNDLKAAFTALGLDPETMSSLDADGFTNLDGNNLGASNQSYTKLWAAEDIGDLWWQADGICRRSISEEQAKQTMRALGIPSTIISQVVQKYFTSYPGEEESGFRMSMIPLSRRDFLEFS